MRDIIADLIKEVSSAKKYIGYLEKVVKDKVALTKSLKKQLEEEKAENKYHEEFGNARAKETHRARVENIQLQSEKRSLEAEAEDLRKENKLLAFEKQHIKKEYAALLDRYSESKLDSMDASKAIQLVQLLKDLINDK